MAYYRKRFRRARRYTRRPKRFKRYRKSRKIVRKHIDYNVNPNYAFTTGKYAAIDVITHPTNTYVKKAYYANSIWHIDQSANAGDITNYTTVDTMFDRYYVYASSITVTFENQAADPVWCFILPYKTYEDELADVEYLAQPDVKKVFLNSNLLNGCIKKLRMSRRSFGMVGRTATSNDIGMGAYPALPWFWIIAAINMEGGEGITVNCTVEIEYKIRYTRKLRLV